MSSLTIVEKAKLEKLFRMGNGYVLGFSDRTLQAFVADSTGLDIFEEKYKVGSGSKANRLRAIWSQETDALVGKLLQDLLGTIPAYWAGIREATLEDIPSEEQRAYESARQACERLLGVRTVESIDELRAITPDENIVLLAKQIRGSLDAGEPQTGLDRLHTLLIKYFRALCDKHGVATSRDEPLNAVFGKYVKFLTASATLKSEMSEKIMRFSINILSSFNYVRNNQSLAHDNEMLNREESYLIISNIAALIKYVEFIEREDNFSPVAKPDKRG